MDNTRQLTLAWISYAHDFRDQLVINDNNDDNGSSTGGPSSWCAGVLDWTSYNSDNTNFNLLISPQRASLAPYFANGRKIFKCPADVYLSPPQASAAWPERVRSVSMDACMGPGWKYDAASWGVAVLTKMSDIVHPGPGLAWVFVDQHPDSINDCMPDVITGLAPGQGEFADAQRRATTTTPAASVSPTAIPKSISGSMTDSGSHLAPTSQETKSKLATRIIPGSTSAPRNRRTKPAAPPQDRPGYLQNTLLLHHDHPGRRGAYRFAVQLHCLQTLYWRHVQPKLRAVRSEIPPGN